MRVGRRGKRTAWVIIVAGVRVIGPAIAILDGRVPVGRKGAIAAELKRLRHPWPQAEDVARQRGLGREAVEPLVLGKLVGRPQGVLARQASEPKCEAAASGDRVGGVGGGRGEGRGTGRSRDGEGGAKAQQHRPGVSQLAQSTARSLPDEPAGERGETHDRGIIVPVGRLASPSAVEAVHAWRSRSGRGTRDGSACARAPSRRWLRPSSSPPPQGRGCEKGREGRTRMPERDVGLGRERSERGGEEEAGGQQRCRRGLGQRRH